MLLDRRLDRLSYRQVMEETRSLAKAEGVDEDMAVEEAERIMQRLADGEPWAAIAQENRKEG